MKGFCVWAGRLLQDLYSGWMMTLTQAVRNMHTPEDPLLLLLSCSTPPHPQQQMRYRYSRCIQRWLTQATNTGASVYQALFHLCWICCDVLFLGREDSESQQFWLLIFTAVEMAAALLLSNRKWQEGNSGALFRKTQNRRLRRFFKQLLFPCWVFLMR